MLITFTWMIIIYEGNWKTISKNYLYINVSLCVVTGPDFNLQETICFTIEKLPFKDGNKSLCQMLSVTSYKRPLGLSGQLSIRDSSLTFCQGANICISTSRNLIEWSSILAVDTRIQSNRSNECLSGSVDLKIVIDDKWKTKIEKFNIDFLLNYVLEKLNITISK